MASKLKMTGFARFFIFLIIAAPLIYAGVSIFQGEHPLDAAKRDFGIDLRGDKTEQVETKDMSRDDSRKEEMMEKMDLLREKNEALEAENAELKVKMKELSEQ